MSNASITCPACLRVSQHRDDVANAYCSACHAGHDRLPPWGFEPFEGFLLRGFVEGPFPRWTESSSRPILDAFRRLGLLDSQDMATPAAQVWAKNHRNPAYRVLGPDYQPIAVEASSCPTT